VTGPGDRPTGLAAWGARAARDGRAAADGPAARRRRERRDQAQAWKGEADPSSATRARAARHGRGTISLASRMPNRRWKLARSPGGRAGAAAARRREPHLSSSMRVSESAAQDRDPGQAILQDQNSPLNCAAWTRRRLACSPAADVCLRGIPIRAWGGKPFVRERRPDGAPSFGLPCDRVTWLHQAQRQLSTTRGHRGHRAQSERSRFPSVARRRKRRHRSRRSPCT